MSGRGTALLLALVLLGAGLVLAPQASAEMEAPTIEAKPALDAEIEEAEWGNAKSFDFGAPRTGESTVRMGYHASSGELALGFVLSDETARDDDEIVVYVAPRTVEEGDKPQSKDKKFVVQGDGDWEHYRGNGTAFPTAAASSGSSPSSTNSNVWSFAVQQEAVSTWVVEMTIDVGDFEAGDEIKLGLQQTDVDDDGNGKSSKRPSGLDSKKPNTWEDAVLSGRPTELKLRLSPSELEAGVGADVTATLPSDADGGRLTVSVKAPGDSGFAPIGTKDPGQPGQNTFFFAPEKTGTYQIKAEWEGDENYQSKETKPLDVDVARPTNAGPTVLETGSMRISFPVEAEGVDGEWEYLNTRVSATDDDGDPLPLVRLDGSNSCRGSPWVGFANLGDGGITLDFDPPVRRSALALTSPQKGFSATWETRTAEGDVRPDTGSGSCKNPVFTNLGNIDDKIDRVDISYTGEDAREVVDVAFAKPVTSTPPKTLARAEPSPLHADGAGEIVASAGSPHRLTAMEATVTSGSQTLASDTCNRPSGQVWIDCRVPVEVPAGTGAIEVEMTLTDRFGTTFEATETLKTAEDHSPPKASLLPRPMLAPPGGAVSVTAEAVDASGLQSISVSAYTSGGESLLNETCSPTGTETRRICKVAVSPPDDEIAFVEATYTDRAGNTATVGPKPIPVRGDDTDGDGLPDDLEEEIGTSFNDTDTDGDGLSDGWEVIGVDRSGDGVPELDLASRGADPLVRDLFLELDWAEHDDHSHEVAYGALQVLRNNFAAHGIRVHADIAEEGGPFDPARFDHGHEVHRHLMDPARAGIYMHVIAGHSGGPAAGGGWTIFLPTDETDEQIDGRVGAQLLHEVGHQLGLGHGGGGETGDGGQAAYAEDYKPNYLSVMNNAYAWGVIVDTTDGLVRVPTYAGLAIDDLDESSLNEPDGVSFDIGDLHETMEAGPTRILEENTVTGLRLRYTCPGEDALVKWALAPQPIDWNCNGASSDAGVEADVNRGGANSGTSTLYSRTDWDALSLEGPPCPQYALMIRDEADSPGDASNHGGAYEPLGLAPCPLRDAPSTPLDKDASGSVHQVPSPQAGIEEADGSDTDGDGKVDDGFADTDADGVVNLIDGCPTVADGTQIDRDRDGEGDRCDRTVPAVSGVEATGTPGGIRVSWSPLEGVLGYNVYRIADGSVTRVGDDVPSATEDQVLDTDGSEGDRYMVRAVNTLLEQGPSETVTATGSVGGGPAGGDGTTDGNGSGTPDEGVPGPGALVAALAVGAAALAARRRRG